MRLKPRHITAVATAALALVAGGFNLMADLPRNRTISLHNIHTDETVTVEYKRNGKNVPEAMEKINWVLRDWRKNEPTQMDPTLIDLLWEIHTELGSKEPINIISGYRSRGTNEMLRKSVGGQASESRHILGKAADVQFPDVPLKNLRYSAMVRERGGVGYYPTSATPFVHVDTDRVRAWPRLPRFELALLFPSGRTQHQPADGGPIDKDDVSTARSRYKDLAVQVAEFHDMRARSVMASTMVADASGLPRFAMSAARKEPAPAPVVAQAPSSPPPPPARTELKVAALTPQPAATVPQPVPQTIPQSVSKAASQPTPQPSAKAPPLTPSLPAPKLVAEPRLVDRPARLSPRPSEEDRGKLAQLAALAAEPQPSAPALVATPAPATRPRAAEPAPRLDSLAGVAPAPVPGVAADQPGKDTDANPRLAFASASAIDALIGFASGWAPAPAFDDDHPEEISYRPFPLAPFLTASASFDDPDLTVMVHPDLAAAVAQLDLTGSVPPMRLRPAPQMAQLMWAHKFSAAPEPDRASVPGVAERKVRTERE